ncbi:MAG: hypothetical protein M1816_006507 [Peltula sp. TS41687]|nr:MAG: hypothetical protein M1816_006507 [Peltula sp. TS41687]
MDDTSNRYQPSELRRVVRQPLTDTTTQVNNSQSKQQQGSADQQKSRKSVHQDLSRKATVNGLNSQFHQTSSPGHARLSTGLREPQQESNRNSQVSQASTNVSGKSRRKVHIGPWVLGKTLGRGASARVRKARHALTGQIAAVKIVSKVAAARAAQTTSLQGRDLVPGSEQDPNRQMPFGIEREVVILKLIEHSHIVSLYDVWENRGELYMVMEYVDGGNMLEYLTGVGLLSESEAVRYFRQMLSALGYCHAFGICHRDLKLENLLIDSSMNLKIADFGFAALQPDNVLLRTSCGSPSYAAPEIINGELYRGDTADIWSCGVILYAFLGGDLPFAADDVQEVLVLVKRGRYRMPKHLSKDAKDLIWWLLQLSPKDRIKIHQIWQHTLIRKYDIVEHDDGTLEQYAGPSQLPIITNYVRPRSVADIDREIFRNLHTLWHTEEPELLAHQLMNEE